MSAAAFPCQSPKDALETASWDQFRPVPSGTVTFFSTPFGWQGLDQVFPASVATEQRWKTFLPWGVPTTVEYFRAEASLNSISNRRPVLYLKASPSDATRPFFSTAAVRLSGLQRRRGGRALLLTKGSLSFDQRWLYASKGGLPVSVHKLSDSTMQLRPDMDLPDGEYLVSLGVDGRDDFEFSVRCSAD